MTPRPFEKEPTVPWRHKGPAGDLFLPAHPRGLVLFAHGSGSSRKSPRNRWVAAFLCREGWASLLLDLLTPEESAVEENRFDIPLLAQRLARASAVAERAGNTRGLPQAYFGASTGAAAALWADTLCPGGARAIVSRGGRPDLAEAVLSKVRAPTLLIVGGADREVGALNERAARQLNAEHRVAVVPGATHLFEEPGALDTVARWSADWFEGFLPLSRSLSAARSGARLGPSVGKG